MDHLKNQVRVYSSRERDLVGATGSRVSSITVFTHRESKKRTVLVKHVSITSFGCI